MSYVLTSVPAVAPRPKAAVVPAQATKGRLESIDILRGVAMVFMALDHVRDFFSGAAYDPTVLEHTTPALFMTRWVTNFCAPAFIFLAGTSVFLSSSRGKSKPELSRFLLTRGIWLIILEVTVLRFAMVFSFDYSFVNFTVLWAIGWSMIALAGLIYLPTWAVAAFGIAMIAGHNLLDGIQVTAPPWARVLWTTLHGPPRSYLTRVGVRAHILYPLIPWIGVMATGYVFGRLYSFQRPYRRKVLMVLGLMLTAAFVVVRTLNVYGDPDPWKVQSTPLYTLLSFLNVSKYPPSLQFLLVTLGPCFVALSLLDRDWGPGGLTDVLLTFGRVPLFFFLVHWATAHALAVVVARINHQPSAWLFQVPPFDMPPEYGYGLPMVYLMWAVVVVGLYPACRWFADLKKRRRDLVWLSYL
jgi:uncharacterized membrane protein